MTATFIDDPLDEAGCGGDSPANAAPDVELAYRLDSVVAMALTKEEEKEEKEDEEEEEDEDEDEGKMGVEVIGVEEVLVSIIVSEEEVEKDDGEGVSVYGTVDVEVVITEAAEDDVGIELSVGPGCIEGGVKLGVTAVGCSGEGLGDDVETCTGDGGWVFGDDCELSAFVAEDVVSKSGTVDGDGAAAGSFVVGESVTGIRLFVVESVMVVDSVAEEVRVTALMVGVIIPSVPLYPLFADMARI